MSTEQTRQCCTCGGRFHAGNFHSKYDKRRPHSRSSRCKSCDAEQSKQRSQEHRQQLKLDALAAYSPDGVMRCACAKCPEHTNPHTEFLTIDHVDGGGRKHRAEPGVGRGWEFYRWLKQQKYPPGYRVLCANCNLAKSNRTDFCCPHERD